MGVNRGIDHDGVQEVVAVRLALRRVGAGENEILVHGEHVDRIDDVMEGAPLPEVVLSPSELSTRWL